MPPDARVIPQAPRRRTVAGRTLPYLLLFSVFCVVSNMVITAFGLPSSTLETWRQTYGQRTFDIAIVGNSMANYNIRIPELRTLLQSRILDTAWGGSMSSAWYLTVKNLIVARLDTPPRLVVIVFRDEELTEAGYLAEAEQEMHEVALSEPSEPLYDQLVLTPKKGAWGAWLFHVLPLYRAKQEVQYSLYEGIRWAVASALRMEPDDLSKGIRVELGWPDTEWKHTDPSSTASDFQDRVAHSFLPAIIDDLTSHGVQPVFIRHKTRAQLVRPENEALQDYGAELSSYFAARSIPYIDFTADKRLTLQEYKGDDHLTESGRTLYTRMVADALRPYLQPAAGSGGGAGRR